MEKLGIIREDVSPSHEDKNGSISFDCDNEKVGEASLVKKAEESLEGENKLKDFISKK